MKKFLLIGFGVIILAAAVAVIILVILQRQNQTNEATTSVSTTSASKSATPSTESTKVPAVLYDTVASKQLTGGECVGTGSVPIIPPMKLDQVSSILPYGLMTGGHVTPIDHQYYNGLDQQALRDTYDVVAPADGKIVNIQHRGSTTTTPLHSKNVPSSDEYRIVFAHTCSFLTYVDLVTSLDDSIKSQLPTGWTPESNVSYHITVKQGQVVGHIGGQTLDFAVWDLSQKPLPGLLVRTAYDNAEAWKVFTAPTSKYLAENIKAATLAKYVRTVDPIDGKIDYDVEGKLIGTWFREGSNGYDGGRATNKNKQNYWDGHLVFAPNFIDPSIYVISHGSYSAPPDIKSNSQVLGNAGDSGAQQFGINGNAPDPATVDVSTGLVKYELVHQQLRNADGSEWHSELSSGLKAVNNTTPEGVLLVQMTAAHKLQVETFPGKTAVQVTGFDSNVLTYNRGDDAKLPPDTRTETAH